jgi:hypothetical protein
VVLYVPEIHELVFQFRHSVPGKSTLRTFQIELVNGVIDHLIAECPIFQHLRFRVGFRDERQRTVWVGGTGDGIRVLDCALVMLPWSTPLRPVARKRA